MKFRSSPLVDHNHSVQDNALVRSPAPERVIHPSNCLCEDCVATAERARMAMKLRGTWGELV